MKRTRTSLLLFMVLAFPTIAFSQIKVSTNGNVMIGSTTDASEDLEITGTTLFDFGSSVGFKLHRYYSESFLTPTTTHNLNIGEYSYQVKRIYTKYLHYTTMYQLSDLNVKENIRPIANSLTNVMQLNPVLFDYKAEIYSQTPNSNLEEDLASRTDHKGFIAQEVQTIYPNLVKYNDEAELLEINYLGILPELVKSIQEQQQLIDEQQALIDQLIQQVADLQQSIKPNL